MRNQTMPNSHFINTSKRIIPLIIFCLSIFYVPTQGILIADPAIRENAPGPEEPKPIVIYYSRSGKTRRVANTLKKELSSEIEEIKSTKDREGWLVAS